MSLTRPLTRSVVRGLNWSRLRAGGGGVNLAALLWPTGTEAGMWLDPSDASTAYQDSAGTTPGAVESPVGKRVSKAGNLSAVLQATATARPVWKSVSGIYSDLFDGTDDGYGTATFAAGTLTNNMDCFIAIKRVSSAAGLLAWNDSDEFFACWQSGAGTSPSSLVGSASHFVNGVSAGVTRGTLDSAIPVGSWAVLEVRTLDLSAWTVANFCNYITIKTGADIGGLILCPAQSDANRAIVRRELGRKVGLSL